MKKKRKTLLLPQASNACLSTYESWRSFWPETIKIVPVFRVDFSLEVLSRSVFNAACTTSPNGVRALFLAGFPAVNPLLVLGEGSLKCAKALGYRNVLVSPKPTARVLFSMIKESFSFRKAGLNDHVVYAHGKETRYSLRELKSCPNIRSVQSYRISLLPEGMKALTQSFLSPPWGVIVSSVRLAQLICLFYKKSVSDMDGSSVRFFCLSKLIADILTKSGLTNVVFSEEPTQVALKTIVIRSLSRGREGS